MNNDAKQIDHSVEPLWHTLLACLYFLLAGVGLMLQEMPLDWFDTAGLPPVDWLIIIFLLIPAIGLAAGWALDFPRWSYPYTGGLLVWSLYLMNASTPGSRLLNLDRQIWGWRAWIPFLLACALGFLLSLLRERTAGMKAKPRFLFLSNVFRDPTLAAYLMFGGIPLLIFISFDEINRLFSLVFMLIFSVVMIAAALLYQRLAGAESRAWALAAGILACVLLIEIGVIAYWLPQNGVNIPLSLAWGVVILLVLLYPIILSHLPKPAQGAKQDERQ